MPVREARFRHAAPRDVSPHRQHFGPSARLVFAASDNAVCFDARLLDTPAPGYEPGLLALFDAAAQGELDRLAGGPVTRRLREVLAEALAAGHGDIGRVARRMGTSARTLQRRLEEEGHDYTALREELREELARSWLGQPHLSLDEIALMLGYSDATAFGRAFRRWTGRPPGEWRTAAARGLASPEQVFGVYPGRDEAGRPDPGAERGRAARGHADRAPARAARDRGGDPAD
jgi:AraC-like DNA-binding protein